MPDTSPFAYGYGPANLPQATQGYAAAQQARAAAQPSGQNSNNNLPPWLQQQQIPGVTGGINNMLRALMASKQAPGGPVGAGGAPLGLPMPKTPSAQPGASAGGSGVPYTYGSAMPPNPMDPTMQALFTRPPTGGGGVSPFGAGSMNAVY